MDLPIAFSVPLWVGVAGPPLLYGIVLLCLLRQWTVERLVGGTVLLSAVHVGLGVAAGAVYATLKPGPYDSALSEALLEFFHAPVLQLTWLPLMVLPVLVVLRAPRRSRRRRVARGTRYASFRRQPAPVLQPAFAGVGGEPTVAPNPSALATSRVQSATSPPSGLIEGRAAALTIDEVIPSVFDRSTAPVPASAPSWPPAAPTEEPWPEHAKACPERPDDAVRIPFNRVRSQLPADAFLRPADAVAMELRDPWHLLVPRDIVVPQLREGEVSVEWEVVADQLPEAALAMSLAEIGQRLPAGRLQLPLDEIIRQLPPEMFDSPSALANPRDLESFPEPFHRVPPSPEGGVDRAPGPEPAPAPPAESIHDLNPAATVEAVAPVQPPPAPPDLSRIDAVTVEERASPVGGEVGAVDAALAGAPAAKLGAGVTGATAAETSALRDPAPEAGAGLADPATLIEARRLATVFYPITPFELGVHAVDGADVVVLSGGSWTREALAAIAGRLAPIFERAERLDAIEQITLRGADGPVVVTALGCVSAGAPVLAAAVPERGTMALLEILSRRAADRYRAAHPARTAPNAPPPVVTAVDSERRPPLEPVAIGSSAQRTIQRIVTTLAVLGPVTPTVFTDGEGQRLLYVFAPTDAEPALVAALARALHTTTAERTTVESIAGRFADHWLLVRPVAAGAGGPALLAVLGERHHRPGLMHHVVGRAARWLERL